jgi:hypothetical protein
MKETSRRRSYNFGFGSFVQQVAFLRRHRNVTPFLDTLWMTSFINTFGIQDPVELGRIRGRRICLGVFFQRN